MKQLFLLVVFWGALQLASAPPYPDRLVWVFGWGLHNDSDVSQITNLLKTASGNGLNGAVLSANLDG